LQTQYSKIKIVTSNILSCSSFAFIHHNLKHLRVNLIPITQLRYQCADCLQYFKDKSILHNHILQKHMKSPELHITLKSQNYSARKCKFCDKLMSYKAWHSHMKEVHSNRLYECSKCDSIFKCLRYLKRHNLYVHNGGVRNEEKQKLAKIQCEVCPAVLAHKHALRTHVRNCHCEKVQCHVCSSVLKKSYLNNHMRRVHYNDGKQHKCFCGKQFRSPRYLKVHIKNTHRKLSWNKYGQDLLFRNLFLQLTIDLPRLRTGALILKCSSTVLCMLYTYKPSSWITLSIKKPHQNPLGSFKNLSIHRTDSGKQLCFYSTMFLYYACLIYIYTFLFHYLLKKTASKSVG
jgi:hypothetical protein